MAAAAFSVGCAKDAETDTNKDAKDYFEAWMAQYYPGVQADANDIYLLEDIPGSGEAVTNQPYVYITYTVTDLEGNISSTTDAKISQRLGTYNKSYYYGPRVSRTSTSLTAGVEHLIDGMCIGGTRKAVIPFWMNTTSRYNTQEQYLKKASSTNSVIYTVTIHDVIEDAVKWEIDSLETHLRRIYGAQPDSVAYGRYYYQINAPTEEVEFPMDTTIYINYIGRLLNGQVFDTNIRDTAVVHNIYSSSSTYTPVAVSWAKEASSLKMNSSSLITGFSNTLFNMQPFEKGIAYFISPLGYSASGSGYLIPGYSPLEFEIELVEKP